MSKPTEARDSGPKLRIRNDKSAPRPGRAWLKIARQGGSQPPSGALKAASAEALSELAERAMGELTLKLPTGDAPARGLFTVGLEYSEDGVGLSIVPKLARFRDMVGERKGAIEALAKIGVKFSFFQSLAVRSLAFIAPAAYQSASSEVVDDCARALAESGAQQAIEAIERRVKAGELRELLAREAALAFGSSSQEQEAPGPAAEPARRPAP